MTGKQSIRFLCFGSGAIGTYLGGSLALDGHTVVFLERPGMAAAIQQRGMTIQQDGQRRTVTTPLIVESVHEALSHGPFDAALLAVKSYDTASVVENIRPFAEQMPPVISFQNGVENEGQIAAVLGPERVLAGTVTTAIGRPEPGTIVVERLRGIGVSVEHPLGKRLAQAMDAAGLHAQEFENARAMKWSKMLTNLLTNASSAILDMTPEEIFADPRLFALEARQLREALEVMHASNIPVVDLPATQVRALAWIVSHLPDTLGRRLLYRAVGKGRGKKMPSLHIDLHSSRGKSEVEYLNGAVARTGADSGIVTPVNQVYYSILMAMTRGEIEPRAFARQPEKLLAALRST